MSTDDRRIAWRSQKRYSPVQDRVGIKPSEELGLPPASERVSQKVNPFEPALLGEREVMRVTYQGDDRCQLACPGCYIGERLQPTPVALRLQAPRKVVSEEDFAGHMHALGSGLQDFFLLGAEATMDPDASAAKLRWATAQGHGIHAITHGAVPPERLERTFGEALDGGGVYAITVSFDSMTAAINNALRGRPYAHEMTLATMEYLCRRGAPIKAQVTVWMGNYATIIDTVEALYARGVRAFGFHHGSLEGIADHREAERAGVGMVEPLAWRALCEQLLAFREQHRDLRQFSVPFLWFTESELRSDVIGDDGLTDAYVEHVDRLERGDPSRKPVHACPALDVPQVYLFANDGQTGRGTVSICQIHNPPGAEAYADYDPEARAFRVRSDPATNQMQHMVDSPHLCPATPMATGAGSDRFHTERGPLYHACRYLASNQMDVERDRFGERSYRDALAYHQQVTRAVALAHAGALGSETPLAFVRRVTHAEDPLRERAEALVAALDELEG